MPDIKVTSAHLERDAYLYIRHNSVWKIMSKWLHSYRD
jgi:hypothetical protein